jgi:hypothetical protein
MILTKLCYRYNQLRQSGLRYHDTVQKLADENFYTHQYMQKLVREAFKETGVDMWRRKGRYKAA